MKQILIAAACAAVLLSTAHAQSTPAKKPVSRDELRACMNSESDIGTRRQAVEVRVKQSREEVAGIQAEAAELSDELKRLQQDGEPSAKMERFDRKVKAHNARAKVVNEKGSTVRAELEAISASVKAYNETCGGITFLPEDRDAILKEREAAKK
jgi:chromosome segregation ATPase